MARYLLTGAAGFIGARVSEMLVDAGHEVLGVDNLNQAYDIRLKHWRLERLKQLPTFSFHEVDICDMPALEQVWGSQTFEAVFNLAARAGVRPSVRDPQIYLQTNTQGALNVLDLCVQRGCGKLIQASTSSLYGAHNSVPFDERADISRPLSPYAASKGAAEMLCHSYHALHGLDVSVLRFFTVYGPAGRPDMSIFRFIQWIAEDRPLILYGDGGQERDFTYIDDIARGAVAAVRPLGYEVINLGGDRPVDLMTIIRQIERLLGKTAIIERQDPAPADVRRTWAAIERAEEFLGWSPQTSLEAGLQASVDWYLKERDWARQIITQD